MTTKLSPAAIQKHSPGGCIMTKSICHRRQHIVSLRDAVVDFSVKPIAVPAAVIDTEN